MDSKSRRLKHIKNLNKAINFLKLDSLSNEQLNELRKEIKRPAGNVHKQRKKKKEAWKRKYLDYLRSDEWAKIRVEMLTKFNFTCNRCGDKKHRSQLHVHHKNYDRLFNENPDDLELLCVSCHNSEHKTVKIRM